MARSSARAAARPGAAAPGDDVLARDAVALEDLHRQEHLAAPGMPRQGAQQPGEGVGDAGMAGGVGGAGVAAVVEDQAREADHGRGGLAGIALEIGERRHRVVVEVEGAGVDEVDEGLPGQPEAHDRVVEGGGDGIAADVAARLALQRVAPPLQPDLAEGGLARRCRGCARSRG